MTTGADLITLLRRKMHDFPRLRIDTGVGDGVSDFFDLGKNVSVFKDSEQVSVAGVLKARGADYTLDLDANQLLFTAIPGAAAAIKVRYKEQVWRDEVLIDALNSGRRMLFPKFYNRDSATITVRNLVKDYQLDNADVNEAAMRLVFGQGPATWKTLRATIQPQGNTSQFWASYRKFWTEWRSAHPFLHIWGGLGVGTILRVDTMYAFTPIVDSATVIDIPDRLHELVVLWAASTLERSEEPKRARTDTANVMQGQFANSPNVVVQSASDFRDAFWDMHKALNSEPPVIELRDMPLPWEDRRGYA